MVWQGDVVFLLWVGSHHQDKSRCCCCCFLLPSAVSKKTTLFSERQAFHNSCTVESLKFPFGLTTRSSIFVVPHCINPTPISPNSSVEPLLLPVVVMPVIACECQGFVFSSSCVYCYFGFQWGCDGKSWVMRVRVTGSHSYRSGG